MGTRSPIPSLVIVRTGEGRNYVLSHCIVFFSCCHTICHTSHHRWSGESLLCSSELKEPSRLPWHAEEPHLSPRKWHFKMNPRDLNSFLKHGIWLLWIFCPSISLLVYPAERVCNTQHILQICYVYGLRCQTCKCLIYCCKMSISSLLTSAQLSIYSFPIRPNHWR